MYLADLTWLQARDVLTPGSLVLLPLGAAAKEHGPHLRLDNDRVLADYLARRIDTLEQVVVAPTLNYHYYPAFAAYAGSTSLRMETARDMVTEIVASLAAFGPRRFYVLNTGISTVHALQPAAAALASQGILMRYTDIDLAGKEAVQAVQQQAGGSHADEIETSIMLYIAASRVDMSKAVDDYHPGKGPLTPHMNASGTYSPSGVYGSATLANVDKGRRIVESMIVDIRADITNLKSAPLPPATGNRTVAHGMPDGK